MCKCNELLGIKSCCGGVGRKLDRAAPTLLRRCCSVILCVQRLVNTGNIASDYSDTTCDRSSKLTRGQLLTPVQLCSQCAWQVGAVVHRVHSWIRSPMSPLPQQPAKHFLELGNLAAGVKEYHVAVNKTGRNCSKELMKQ